MPASLLLASNLKDEMIEWRHTLHRCPEFGFEEIQTSDFIAEKLREFGINVVRNIGKTGLLGVLRKGSSTNSIGLRADMDALKIQEQNHFDYQSRNDGLMHACGHDGHSAMLLGAAKHLAACRDFSGTVFFIFQPAEEHGRGALCMIDDGLFERFRIDSVYGLHNMPGLSEGHFAIRPGSIMASETAFQIHLHGRGGHSALPFMSMDILGTASQIVIALQSIPARELSSIREPAVVAVTEFVTDGTVNVTPSNVTIKGDCRCFGDDVLKIIRASMERIVTGACLASGAEFNFDFDTTFPATINSAKETQHAIRAASQAFGEDHVTADCEPFTISEDFANMLQLRPGCYGLLGNGTDSVGGCGLHNPNYDFNDNILLKGAAYWVQLVENQLRAE